MQKRLSTVARARRLRRDPTEAEKRVWAIVRNRQLFNLKFRRQHRLGPYICDFACEELRLIIELDGGQHNEIMDAPRTAYLQQMGYTVVRLWNSDVMVKHDLLAARLYALLKPYQEPSPALLRKAPSPFRRQRDGSVTIFALIIFSFILAACTTQTAYTQADPLSAAQEQWRQEAGLNAGTLGASFKATNFTTLKYSQEERLHYIAGRILVAAAPLCGERVARSYLFGLEAVPYQSPKVVVPLVVKALGETNDLLYDDRLAGIDGAGLATGPLALKQVEALTNSAARENRPLTLHLERGRSRQPLKMRIIPPLACTYPFHLKKNKEINAYANGDALYFYSGLVGIMENDHELAAIIGHELAHNILRHVQTGALQETLGRLGGTVLDTVLKSQGVRSGDEFGKLGESVAHQYFTPAQESEADYVGAYLMTRADFNPEAAISAMDKLAVAAPDGIHEGGDHPNTGQRVADLRLAVAEIRGKQARGEPLIPKLRSPPSNP